MKYLFAFIIVLISFSGFAQNSLWTIHYSVGDLTQVRKYDFNGSYNMNWTSNLSHYQDFVIGDSDNDGIGDNSDRPDGGGSNNDDFDIDFPDANGNQNSTTTTSGGGGGCYLGNIF